MNKVLYFAGLICGSCLLLSGCTKEEWILHPEESEIPGEMKESRYFDFTVTFDETERETYASMPDHAPEGDIAYIDNQTFADVVTVNYDKGSVVVEKTNPLILVMQNGTNVEVNSFLTTGVEYILKGTCTDGSFKVSTSIADYKITLSDVELTNPHGAALYILPTVTARAFVYAKEGTVNKLTGCMDANSSEKACVKSGGDLVFCGSGTTEILSNRRHAVETKGNVYLRGGCRMRITTAESGSTTDEVQPKDGIHAGGNVVMTGGEVDITTVGDGVQSESGNIYMKGGFLKVVTSGEKSHAIKTTGNVYISGGAFQSKVSGNASKCISADGNLEMTGGRMTLMTEGSVVYDATINDMSSCAGIKTAKNVHIDGGIVQISSTGDAGKGINTDGTLVISGEADVKIITSGRKAVEEGVDSNPRGISADAGIIMSGSMLWVNVLGGTSGCDGLDTKNSVTINSGDIRLRCYDDCMKADKDIIVNGGTLCCYSDNNDGIDAKGSVTINGGLVMTCGAASTASGGKGEGVDATDFVISNGTVVAIGGGESMPSTSSTQNCILYSTNTVTDTRDVYCIRNEANESLMAFQLPCSFNSMHLTFSSKEFKTGENYKLYRGWRMKPEGDPGVFGYFVTVPISNEVELSSFHIQSAVTQLSEQ